MITFDIVNDKVRLTISPQKHGDDIDVLLENVDDLSCISYELPLDRVQLLTEVLTDFLHHQIRKKNAED